ncbi:MAG: hypothetical protein J5792_05525, partial [Bacteroidales bacterium]|nr:hypothetical protein [Bacteroidales bacterium]
PDGIMYKGEFRGAYKYYENENNEYKFRWIRIPSGRENLLWANAPLRLLFLTKDQNTGDNPSWDVRSESFRYLSDEYKPEELWIDSSRGNFFKNLVYLFYGLMNTTVDRKIDYHQINEKDALSYIDDEEHIFARINCKKEVGGAQCPNGVLANAIYDDVNKDFLKQQILNLDADIFVCCGLMSFMPNLLNDMGYHFESQDDDKWIYYDLEENKLAINSYHLSLPGFKYEGLISAYHDFLKKLYIDEQIDFTKSHRI